MLRHTLICLLTAFMIGNANAFSAAITPPRFELKANAGQTVRDVIEINHVAKASGNYRIYTNDWRLRDDGGVDFEQSLTEGSCRPWVAIERPTVTLPANGKIRYRFEVQVPADAKPQECRFAIMVEGAESTVNTSGGPVVPVSGRVGVIVYVKVGDASAVLDVVSAGTINIEGKVVPAIRVKNTGTAHTRLNGFVKGRDAKGTVFDLVPAEWPILPGRERMIPLMPESQGGVAATPVFPIDANGHLEWGGKRIPFQQRFVQ